jgi:UDP:flavonoid glycosyltransferase YjiC (YdhE family)
MPAWRQMLVDEWEAARGADAVVYHPKAFGGYHIAEALGVPGFLALPVPALSPTRAFPVPVLPLPNLGGALNNLSYGLFFRSSTAPYRCVVNRWRERTLGLPPLSLLSSELELSGEPVTKLYCCSPHIVPAPADWDGSSLLTGYWFLNQGSEWLPPEELTAFLEEGYTACVRRLRLHGARPRWLPRRGACGPQEAGVARGARDRSKRHGRSGCYRDRGGAPRLVVPTDGGGSAPRGAGTTAEGLRAGKPTAVFPSNLGDQLFWGRRVHTLGAGPVPIPQKKFTTERLAAAIRAVTEDEGMRRLAEELGERIRAENGVARAADIIGGARETS